MSETAPMPMQVTPAGEGFPLATPAPTSIICREAWTEGGLCVFDQVFSPGTITAAHAHGVETQGAYVLAGEIGFWTDGEEATVGAGGYVVRPAGTVHAVWNATDSPARMLEITSPAERFERFILGFNEILERGDGEFEEIVALAARYGTHFHPEVTAELSARHGVSTSGGGYSFQPEEESK